MVEFAGFTFKNQLTAASSPLTESIYRLRCSRDAGFSSAILKSATDYSRGTIPYGRKIIYSGNGYYADSSFEREIMTIDEALALYEKSKALDKSMKIIPSIAISSLRTEDWYEMCVRFQENGAELIQLDFFYLGSLLCDESIYKSVYRSLTNLNNRLSATLMPKINIHLNPEKICRALVDSGTKCISLLDSIRKVPALEFGMHEDTTSYFGPEQLPTTLEYLREAAKNGLEICAGGGVNSAEDVELLISNGAKMIQIASYVLKNGFSSLNDLLSNNQNNKTLSLSTEIHHHTWCDKEEGFPCEMCGACKNIL